MRLSSLLSQTGLSLTVRGNSDPIITGITDDSRKCKPGFLFAAIPGSEHDGRAFIPQACAAEAAAVLSTPDISISEDIAYVSSETPRRDIALLAARFSGLQPDHIVAVTGTNGKTSTVDFIRQIQTLRGRHAVSLGTLGLRPEISLPVSFPYLTTPDPITLAAGLSALRQAGITDVAMEASSHGLDQCRLDGVDIKAAGFTNLTRDHLDYHGNMDAYRNAKLRLFDTLLPEHGLAAANADMDTTTLEALREIASRRSLNLRLVGENGRDIRLLEYIPRPEGQLLKLETSFGRAEILLKLPGRFQADNVLLAAALCDEDEQALPEILSLLPQLTGVPGRLEHVLDRPEGAAAYVDFAHTPDALTRALNSLRPHASGRLIVVFGAGGNRDKGKRPLMAAAAAAAADIVIVTDDNPRHEAPDAIRKDVMAGAPDALEIGDRRKAMAEVLSMLRRGDVLLVAGKGHEQGQIIGSEVFPFDDASVLRELAGE